MKGKKGKCVVTLLLVVTMLFMAVGCRSNVNDSEKGNDNEGKSATNEVNEEVKGEKNEIVVFTHMIHASWFGKGWEAIEEDIQNRKDELGFVVEFEKIPEGEQGQKVMATRFVAGEYADFLSFNLSEAMDLFKDDTLFLDISGEWTENFFDDAIHSDVYSYNDQVLAVPMGSSLLFGTFYNKPLFEELGLEIPQTWDEMLATCEQIKAAGKVPVYISGSDAWTTQMFLKMAMDAGISVNDTYNKINTNQLKYSEMDSLITGLGQYKELFDKGYVNETWLADTYDGAQKALSSGDAGMYFIANFLLDEINEKYPEGINDIGGFAAPVSSEPDKVLARMPSSVMMTKGINNAEVGQKYIEYLGSLETQQLYFDAQPGIPIAKGVDAMIYPAAKDLYAIYSEDGRGDIWNNQLQKYSFGDLSNVIEFLIGEITAEELAQRFDTETSKNAVNAGDTNWE